MRLQKVLVPALTGSLSSSTTRLYASSYSGTVTTLSLTRQANGIYDLQTTSAVQDCGKNPSWLTFNRYQRRLYCTDENLSGGNGSLVSYSVADDGKLSRLSSIETLPGPVSSVEYNYDQAIALAHYGGSAVSTFRTAHDGALHAIQNFTYTLDRAMPDPERQEAPHPHQVLVDPTHSYLLALDLGASVYRDFDIVKSTSELTQFLPIVAGGKDGPRHAVFAQTSDRDIWFYVVNELSNTISAHRFYYQSGEGGRFRLWFIDETSVYGNAKIPAGASAAEIVVSPDNRFVITSVRNDSAFPIAPLDKPDLAGLVSDSLQTWKIDPDTGKLSLLQIAPAGGRNPRHFSINKDGTLVAVGLQTDGRVAIIERNVHEGTLGNVVAEVDVAAGVTSVVWDE